MVQPANVQRTVMLNLTSSLALLTEIKDFQGKASLEFENPLPNCGNTIIAGWSKFVKAQETLAL